MGSQQNETSAYQRARLPPATDLSLSPVARSPKSDATTTTPATAGTAIGVSGASIRKLAPSSARGSSVEQNYPSKILPRGACAAAASGSGRASSTRPSAASSSSKPKAAAAPSSLLDNIPVVRTQLLMPFGAADMAAHGAVMHGGAFPPAVRQRQQPPPMQQPLPMQQQQQPPMQQSPMQQPPMQPQRQESLQQPEQQWFRGPANLREDEGNGEEEGSETCSSSPASPSSSPSSSSSSPRRPQGRGYSQPRSPAAAAAAAAGAPSPWLLDEGPAGGSGGLRSLRGSFGALALADVAVGGTGLGAGRPPKPPLQPQLQPGGSKAPQQEVGGRREGQ